MEIELKIKNGHLMIYEVNCEYIPFTSKVKQRNSKLTINIKNKNKVIAQLLLNNMIPVTGEQIKLVDIEKEKYSDYLKSEIVYLTNKKVIEEIITKDSNVFDVIENKKHIDNVFFKSICCDFTKIESVYKNYRV